MKRSIVLVSVAVLGCVACGGKTIDGDLPAGDGGATATGGSASGGSASGGGGNVGGFGGVSNVGGSGGAGNAGGFGGVGAGGNSGLDIHGKIKTFCVALKCATFNCVDELTFGVKESAKAGCSVEYERVIDCALDFPVSCNGKGEPQLAPECDPILGKFEQCLNGNGNEICGGGSSSDGSCDMQCPSWGGKCAPQPGGLSCVCTYGPNASFQALLATTCNSQNWSSQLEKLCN